MSIVAAKQALFDTLAIDEDGTPHADLSDTVVAIFKGEPAPGVAPKPSAVTIFTMPALPTEYQFRVTVYQSLAGNALDAQDAMDATLDALNGIFDADERYGRTAWDGPGFTEAIDALVAQTTVTIGREDF